MKESKSSSTQEIPQLSETNHTRNDPSDIGISWNDNTIMDIPEPECELIDSALELSEEEDDGDLSYVSSTVGDGPIMDGFMAPKAQQHDSYSSNTMMSQQEWTDYILGTLIVRVAAARDLRPTIKGGLGNILFKSDESRYKQSTSKSREIRSQSRRKIIDKGISNPYAVISFGNQSHRTSVVLDTVDPTWPREEQYYLDVSLPVFNLAHTSNDKNDSHLSDSKSSIPSRSPPSPVVTISLRHSNEPTKSTKEYNYSTDIKQRKSVDSNETSDSLLGCVSFDITGLINGMIPCFDEWLDLTCDGNFTNTQENEESAGQVRVICEYEPTDPPPRPGDLCRFTAFVHVRDLYPLPPGQLLRVDNVMGDYIIISYRTKVENWLCTCRIHRFMIICEHRHQTAVERYQDELFEIADKLAHSPMLSAVQKTVNRLPEDGAIFLGMELASKGIDLVGRWFQNGFDTAIGDVIDMTNWDGRYNPRADEALLSNESSDKSDYGLEEESVEDLDELNNYTRNMPNCPITGLPMKNPVVAADGHTYERSAITRWLKDNNTSPLTGSILPHKELVPNYLLISSVESRVSSA